MLTTKLPLLLLAATLAACGTTIQDTPINMPPHAMAARAPETVEVFASGTPSRPHIDVSYLEAEQSSGFSEDDTPQFVAKLRAEAGRRGCDAIVLGGVTHDVNVYGRSSSNQKGITATCVVYTGP